MIKNTAGLDLEMPGPARWMGDKALEAVRSGRVEEENINDKVRRLLRTLMRTGTFSQAKIPEEQSIDLPEHRQLIRKIGGEATVLLKNEGDLLPLEIEKLHKIALIGANAEKISFQGGGSSQVNPHYVISPLDAISARAGDKIEVEYSFGCIVHDKLPLIERDWLIAEDDAPGRLDVRYYDNILLEGKPVHQVTTGKSQLSWFGEKAEHFDPNCFSMRIDGAIRVPESGVYTFELGCVGLARLFIDDDCLVDLWEPEDTEPSQEHQKTSEIEFKKGKPYRLRLEYASKPEYRWRGVRLGCLPPLPEDPIAEAVTLAEGADAVIVVAGLTPEWETEGHDRVSMDLPGNQDQLIERVAAANSNTIVVLNVGSPVHMPWLDQVKAVMQMWYLGQESGNALADVLFGDADPSGRLPTTFPKRIQDNPAYINFPGENDIVQYGEGIFVGYRYYDKKGIEPLFPFGHGLSYTTFEYDNLRLNADHVSPGEVIQVQVDVTNTGERNGHEVIQLYLQDVQSSLVRPSKELKAFTKIKLKPGETKTIELSLQEDDLAFYDDAKMAWVVEPGHFEVLIGRSAGDIRLSDRFDWTADT